MGITRAPTAAVYTALFGGYEQLNEAQEQGDGSVPFICFTDDIALRSSVWDVRLVAPLFAADLQRSQRDIKIRGHRDLDQFERTLYIDNSVSLMGPPSEVLDDWLRDDPIAIPAHSYREAVLDEFRAVLEIGLDDPARVHEQLHHYSTYFPEILEQRPYWGGMIARRRSPEVAETMNRWFDEVCRYSRRDQLSANVVFSQSPIRPRAVEIDNHGSSAHRWPVSVGRKSPESAFGSHRTLPNLAREQVLDGEVRELRRELSALRQTEQALRQTEHALAQAIQEMHSSRSWRITAPLRRLRSLGRKEQL